MKIVKIAEFIKIYGENVKWDQAHIQSRSRVKITFGLHHKIYS